MTSLSSKLASGSAATHSAHVPPAPRPLMTTAHRLLLGGLLLPVVMIITGGILSTFSPTQWLLVAGASVIWTSSAATIYWMFRYRIVEPILHLQTALDALLEGRTDVKLLSTDGSEIGVVSSMVNDLTISMQSVVDQATTIADGDYSATISPRSSADKLGMALYEMTETLRNRADICEAVASGHYSIDTPIKSDRDMLGLALNRMIRQLRSVTERIAKTGTELVLASTEQAEGARNQSVAIEEMATTVSELLASATSVSESAANVAEQAERAADECSEGSSQIGNAAEGITGIHDRVSDIARLMLDLGVKSQQISGVLNIITELSEQTNLLSLNASIEAAGAGEAGKRFAVVAGEIRKLAERAAESSDEIRNLIQGVQEMVNTTILATEEGTKSVQKGVRLIEEVDHSFERIATQVASTAASARAIELGNRQQAIAIAEMQKAVSNVDISAREASSSAAQVNLEAQSLNDCVTAFQPSTAPSLPPRIARSQRPVAVEV